MKPAALFALLSLLLGCERAPDYAGVEPGEALPGGATTLTKLNPDVSLSRHAYSRPAANLPPKQRGLFAVGNSFFTAPWVSAPSSVTARDGLGPLFNAAACQDCHIRDGRGRPPSDDGKSVPTLVKIATSSVYGGQIQDRALPGVPAEARVVVEWDYRQVKLAGGETVELRRPAIALEAPAYGPLIEGMALGLRVAPPLIGLGLLEAIPESALLALEDPEDADGDGISGRVNRVWSEERQGGAIGRFGWKAGQPSVREQSLTAFARDMGITSSLFPVPVCTEAQQACLAQPSGGEPELSAEVEKAVVFYARHLAVPGRRWHDGAEILAGKRLFHQLGCASCHRPRWVTGNSDSAALVDQVIWPYTDLLLHDMGPELADGIDEFVAGGSEWRTPPLWGIHLAKAVGGAEIGFLHDGRARNFKEAILWHGGEAKTARDAWAQLPKTQREQLIWFLKSL